ncbi:MAG: YceI family protein [Maribacter sp.]|nr:YceI family protein [Maribacter sp.]
MHRLIFVLLVLVRSAGTMAQESFTLAPESVLTISGTSTVHDWTVTASTMQGVLTKEGSNIMGIDFQVDVAGIKSERGATMDNKMYAALKIEEYPKVLFSFDEQKSETTFKGSLVIAGKENSVELDVIIHSLPKKLRIAGEKKLALLDYGIEPPTAMFGQVIVGDDVVVKFDLVFESNL